MPRTAIARPGRINACGSPTRPAAARDAGAADSGPAAGCAAARARTRRSTFPTGSTYSTCSMRSGHSTRSWIAILCAGPGGRNGSKGYGCEGGVSMSAGVLLVAGGSRGIGEAIAVLGAERGYDVVLSYATNEARAAAVVERIRAAGGSARAVQADTAHEADIDRLFAAADEVGPLAAL